jgi:hypothetical protein
MGIVKTGYFKNEIYLPHAAPNISSDLTDVESKVENFINQYERDCLVKCLGGLSLEFFENLDSNESSYIKSGSDAKWNELLNGKTYSKSGRDYFWKGIVSKFGPLGTNLDSSNYKTSFLAYYIYFFYEKNDFLKKVNGGGGKVKVANLEHSNPGFKAVNAWNEFVTLVQGEEKRSPAFYKKGNFGGCYFDYSQGFEDSNVCLYEFINDMNDIDEDCYKLFEPKRWDFINQHGI